MRGTKLKPFNDDAGYVCMTNTPFGYAVVYDRENGADWMDADDRWVTVAYDTEHSQISMISSRTVKLARDAMKGARELGFACDWVSEFLNSK